jgi:hypothetical protein
VGGRVEAEVVVVVLDREAVQNDDDDGGDDDSDDDNVDDCLNQGQGSEKWTNKINYSKHSFPIESSAQFLVIDFIRF